MLWHLYTVTHHSTWILEDDAEVMYTSVIITNAEYKSIENKTVRLWHRPNTKFTTYVLARVSLTNTYDISRIMTPMVGSQVSPHHEHVPYF
jgi:hypothetical protein